MAILLPLLATATAVLAIHLIRSRMLSPIRNLRGPESSHWFYGNLLDVKRAEEHVTFDKWVEEHGRTFKFKWLFGDNRIYTLDSKALNHVMMHSYIYQRPEFGRFNLARIVGQGLLVTEGEKHTLQRKVMNPAFGTAQTRDMTEIFVDKAMELKDVFLSQIEAEGGTSRINVLEWISRMTLDVIGLAGFNYDFNGLKAGIDSNEMGKAFNTVFGAAEDSRFGLLSILQSRYPIFRIIPNDLPGFSKGRETMNRIGRELLRDSKASLKVTGEQASGLKSKDLLTLLIRSNMSEKPGQRMSDEDVLAQVPTFITAGFETTSTGTTWALYGLVRNLDVQRKLRKELFTLNTDNPTMDQLNSLPYLDMVVRETLRIYSPVTMVVRVAQQDDVIPLENPITDKNGTEHSSLTIPKGTHIVVSILGMNRDKARWGEDVLEFKPERWEKLPEAVNSIPGVWGNQMTFLGGPRACIGYRFALVEMKALLFVLLKHFEFEAAVPDEDMSKSTFIVQRPRVKSDPQGGSQLPLIVKAYKGLD